MSSEQPRKMCSKHGIPYEEIGYGRRFVCIECHKENLEKYYKEHKQREGSKKS